ncbi:MAG: glycosyltransferase family 4 protein [Pseudomonadales bacterium]|nr:glycosyltransferase family 4 protein [Pseudomonadales bacterium]
MSDRQESKKLLFTLWDYVPKEDPSRALVGGMVKNPAYLFEAIPEESFEKHSMTTSKDPVSEELSDPSRMILDTRSYVGFFRFISRLHKFSRAAERLEPLDLVHAHTPALAPTFSRSGKLIVTAHGTHWPEFWANFRLSSLKDVFVLINAFVQFQIEKRIYRSADAVVSVSEFQVKELVEDYGIDRSKVHVIYNGVNQDTYKVREHLNRDIDVLFVGRPVPKKGIEVLVEALQRLNQDLNVVFVFGGGWVSTPNVAAQVTPEIESLGGIVKHSVSEETLAELLSRSKILVAPSLGYESIPTVVFEAISSGAVPIATGKFGTTELLPPKLLLEEGDVEQLSLRLENVLKNLEDYQKLLDEVDLSKFTLSNCLARHLNLYRSVLG